MRKKKIILKPHVRLIEKNKKIKRTGFSIIIPSYMRPTLLIKCLRAIKNSEGLSRRFKATIYIVDGTPPDNPNKKKIIEKVKDFSKNCCVPIYLLNEIRGPSITNAKIEGSNFAKHDGNGLIAFIDTDIFVANDALLKTYKKFRRNKYAAWISRRSIWKGKGPKNGVLWKPEPMLEARTKGGTIVKRNSMGMMIKNKKGLKSKRRSVFISAIHGDFICMYKEVYFKIGGYDILFGGHGENVDLSIRCWRFGYPLVYEDDIVMYHSIYAPYSIMRSGKSSKKQRARAILSTPLKICYIYGSLKKPNEMQGMEYIVYEKWVKNLYKTTSFTKIPMRIIYSLTGNIDFLIDRYHLLRKSRKRAYNAPYSTFMPYDIFKDLKLFKKCIAEAPKRLEDIRKRALFLK